ncbi:MAG: hypothetical protein JSU94_10410 [Phycisphaerales bacterium]|nr:MAG: hypothetical protein JSU94_10410 [Phycisphaerales bacterium]
MTARSTINCRITLFATQSSRRARQKCPLTTARHSRLTCILLLFALTVCCGLSTATEPIDVISPQQLKPDKACGPRSLWALMQITGRAKPDCGLECIYAIIGKPLLASTSLKDLKDAALKLGFSAKAYKLTLSRLAKTDGYAIIPVGNAPGTPDKPLHFVLVKRVTKDYLVVINAATLAPQAIAASDLGPYWNGYALIISAPPGSKPLPKNPDIIDPSPGKTAPPKYDEIKNFGPVDSGSRLEHTFTISKKPEPRYKPKIVQKSCSCLSASLGADTAGCPTITLQLHVDKPAWQEAHAVVLLEPAGIIKRYAVRAYGNDSFRISPEIAYIQAPNGGSVEYPVKISYFTSVRDVVTFETVNSSSPNLSFGQADSRKQTKGETCTYVFDIPLIYEAGPKPESSKLVRGKAVFVLNTTTGQRHIPLKVIAQIGVDKFTLTPETVFAIVSKSSTKPVLRKVKLQFLIDPPPTQIPLEYPLPFSLRAKTDVVSPGAYMMTITLPPEKIRDMPLGLNKGRITIHPKGISALEAISLPITLFVRP